MRRTPDAKALKAGAAHQGAAAALAAVRTTGVRKGIYRFRSHADANRHAEEALARAIAANLRARKLIG
ncbi:MAG: hypothetical protein ACT4P4_27025 [Betaproteobacteria bacterium]